MITSFVFKALDRKARWVAAILLAVALLVPLANLGLPADHPLHVPNYTISLVGKYLTYALLALALDLVWGYCGILSLGHGAFFALGGYAMGMYLMRQIGSRGVYGEPVLPDFMVFLNWQELPWFWYGSDKFWFAAVMILAVPGLLAFVFVVSAMVAGVAGVLYIPQVGIINPGEFAPANSIEVVIWTAVGGRGTLVGPIIGAVLVNTGKSVFIAAFPEFWLFALGALFVAVTLFLPKGIVGTIAGLGRYLPKARTKPPLAAAPKAAE